MSYKRGTYISLIFFATIGVLFYVSSMDLPPSSKGQIGPGYFPELISGLLIIFCFISFISTWRKSDEHVEILNFRYIIFTVFLSILFVAIWQLLGGFYILAFITMVVMLYVLNQSKHRFKKALNSMAVSFLITLLVYLVFDKLFNLSM